MWTNFLSEQRRATDFVEPAGGRAANDSLYDARAVRNSFHGKEASAPLHRRACTSPYAFLQRVCMRSQVLLSTMHVQVCTLDRCCEHQRTHLFHARYRMCICAHVCAFV